MADRGLRNFAEGPSLDHHADRTGRAGFSLKRTLMAHSLCSLNVGVCFVEIWISCEYSLEMVFANWEFLTLWACSPVAARDAGRKCGLGEGLLACLLLSPS